MQQRIRQGPAQVQQVLLNLQRHLEEERLLMALKVRPLPFVSVQGKSCMCIVSGL